MVLGGTFRPQPPGASVNRMLAAAVSPRRSAAHIWSTRVAELFRARRHADVGPLEQLSFTARRHGDGGPAAGIIRARSAHLPFLGHVARSRGLRCCAVPEIVGPH
ncbi:hypothetical protein HPB50_007419 [Hyalomma asiaticum]|uniref:Uncharacterized protein n=1 Tax=Hyalomma asiaticum TaxID=266040 RepID=A0ACB7TIF1_HYAAI|nr:hypothetical protein HPB50_007419 [Hyalomma asiaticum]